MSQRRAAGAAVDRALRLMADRAEREPLRPSELVRAVRDLLAGPSSAAAETTGGPDHAGGEGSDPAAQQVRLARLRTVCRRLVRQNRYQPVQELLDLVLPAWDPDPRLGLHALHAHAVTSLTGQPAPGLTAAATAALQGADAALAEGDLDRCAELVVIGAGLLLHRDLHADVEHSPLVEDPEGFLAPVRASSAMRALAAPTRTPPPPPPTGRAAWRESARPGAPCGENPPDRAHGAAPAVPRGPAHQDRRRRVVVLPGAYPRFAAPLITHLRQHPDLEVRVLDLIEDHPAYRWLGTDPALVRIRLAGTFQVPDPAGFTVTDEHLRALQQADVVVADWADKGAVWASLQAPASARLVIRAHGMDTFSLWPHVIDWSRVDELVAVSAHQVEVFADVIRHGAGPALPRGRAVPNIVRLPAVSDPPPRNPHALALIGWGKRVKDPIWAVEVLAGLLARQAAATAAGEPEREWTLVLVGDGFAPGRVVTSQEYAAAFDRRAAALDVVGRVRHVPQTDDVAGEVAQVGFVLSSSTRESFHQGLVEGVLGGAVPVVRDWPFFAGRNGARRLFPPAWVVPDVTAAVDRVWALRDAGDRVAAAAQARAQVADRFDPDRTARHLVQVVLGSESADAGERAPGQ